MNTPSIKHLAEHAEKMPWEDKAPLDARMAFQDSMTPELFMQMFQALYAAETVLRYLPDLNTNWGGERPTMTTRRAERMVKAAIAKATGGAQ